MIRNIILCCIAMFCVSCEEATQQPVECEEKICTMEFRFVSVRFKDSKNETVPVQKLQIKNLRSNKFLVADPSKIDSNTHLIVSDNDKKNLSEEGDTLLVTAIIDSLKAKSTEARFVVAGGKCACHIHKIAGPEEVVVD